MPRDERRLRLFAAVAGAAVVLGLGVLLAWGSDDEAPAPSTTTTQPADPDDDGETSAPADTATTSTTLPGEPDRVLLAGFDEVAVRVLPAGAGDDWLSWCLLAARTAAQRSQGLMGVTDLQGYSGMAFVYDQDVENAFWMRNTPTPLSIAWISADGQVVSIADMAPCEDRADCPRYPPGGPYRYAIEVFQGDLPALGITEGSTVELGGACAPRS